MTPHTIMTPQNDTTTTTTIMTPQNDTTTTTTIMTPQNDTTTAESKKTPKQWMIGASEDDKREIAALCREFVGPGVTKPYAMTEKECVNLILHVAKNNRYSQVDGKVHVSSLDLDGQVQFDETGEILTEEIDGKIQFDRFSHEAKRIFSLREGSNKKPAHKMNELELVAALNKLRGQSRTLEEIMAELSGKLDY
jgi:hypothetical protein